MALCYHFSRLLDYASILGGPLPPNDRGIFSIGSLEGLRISVAVLPSAVAWLLRASKAFVLRNQYLTQ